MITRKKKVESEDQKKNSFFFFTRLHLKKKISNGTGNHQGHDT